MSSVNLININRDLIVVIFVISVEVKMNEEIQKKLESEVDAFKAAQKGTVKQFY